MKIQGGTLYLKTSKGIQISLHLITSSIAFHLLFDNSIECYQFIELIFSTHTDLTSNISTLVVCFSLCATFGLSQVLHRSQGVSLANVDSQYDNIMTKPHQGGAK